MRIEGRYVMNRKTAIIISSAVILILIISVISYFSLSDVIIGDLKNIDLKIVVDSQDPRVGEIITLSVNEISDDSNITWEIRSEKYFGKQISISFNESDYYEIVVKSTNNKEEGFGNLTLDVKNQDIHEELSIDRRFVRVVEGWTGVHQSEIQIFNGTSSPTIHLIYEIPTGTGDVGFEIWGPTDTTLDTLESESVRLINEGHTFEFTIILENLVDINPPYEIFVNLVLYQGYIDGFNYGCDINY